MTDEQYAKAAEWERKGDNDKADYHGKCAGALNVARHLISGRAECHPPVTVMIRWIVTFENSLTSDGMDAQICDTKERAEAMAKAMQEESGYQSVRIHRVELPT